MIREPEDEAFEELEKAQQRRGVRVFDDDDDIQEYKKPWRSLSDEQYQRILKQTEGCGHLAFYNLIEKALRELNT
jgi:hypothetical protein